MADDVFHGYQWDLNYTNPAVFLEVLDSFLFYGNLGVDMGTGLVSDHDKSLTWQEFKKHGAISERLFEHWTEQE